MRGLELGGGHIRFLDGVRGVAILYVLFSHTSLNSWHIIPGMNMSMSGKIGVYLFFILSSFLLTSQMLTAYRNKGFSWWFLTSYFTARIFRIFPLYLLVLIFAVLVAGWFDYSKLWGYVLLQNTSHHLWAIPVEFKFYLLLPVIFFAYIYVLRERLLVFAILATLFYVLFSPMGGPLCLVDVIPRDLASPWKHLPVFLLGFAGAILHERKSYPTMHAVLAAFAMIVLVTPMLLFYILELLGVVLEFKEQRAIIFGMRMELLLGFAWLIVLLGSVRYERLNSIFSAPFLVLTGKISFSLYLLHFFLFPLVRRLDMPGSAKAYVLLIASYIVAYISYIVIEKNGIRVGKAVTKWAGLQRAAISGN